MFGTYQRLSLHVGASGRDVVRAASLKVAEHHRTAPAMREARKAFYRQMLEYHSQARELARYVAAGG